MTEILHNVDCTLDYELDGPTDFVFLIHAAHHPDQRIVSESLALTPGVGFRVVPVGGHGNRMLRLHAGAGPLHLRYRAQVMRIISRPDPRAEEWPVQRLPDDVIENLMPTRYCESDLLGPAAQKLFGAHEPGYARAQAICDWIHDNIEYRVGTSNATTTSRDIFVQRVGVCRDFAHLGITFCRALNIPARLVSGYVRFDEPPPDFHAVFEAFLGGRWVLFDPTGLAPVERLVRIATGRDAKDIAFATSFGPARMTSMAPCIDEAVPGTPDASVGHVLQTEPVLSDTGAG